MDGKNILLVASIVGGTIILGVGGSSVAKSKDATNSGRAGNWRSNAQGAPSIKECRKRVAENPSDADAQSDLGWALRQNGQLKEAETCLRKAICPDLLCGVVGN